MSQLSHAVLTETVAYFNAASRPNYVGGQRQRGRPRVGRILPRFLTWGHTLRM
jgi:hypothetical protein